MTPTTLRTLRAVCEHLNVDLELTRSGSQLPRCVRARDITMWVLRQHYRPRPTLVELGLEFDRHNSSVLSALARVELRLHDEATIDAISIGRDALGRTKAQWVKFAKERELEGLRARMAELEQELGMRAEAAE